MGAPPKPNPGYALADSRSEIPSKYEYKGIRFCKIKTRCSNEEDGEAG